MYLTCNSLRPSSCIYSALFTLKSTFTFIITVYPNIPEMEQFLYHPHLTSIVTKVREVKQLAPNYTLVSGKEPWALSIRPQGLSLLRTT